MATMRPQAVMVSRCTSRVNFGSNRRRSPITGPLPAPIAFTQGDYVLRVAQRPRRISQVRPTRGRRFRPRGLNFSPIDATAAANCSTSPKVL